MEEHVEMGEEENKHLGNNIYTSKQGKTNYSDWSPESSESEDPLSPLELESTSIPLECFAPSTYIGIKVLVSYRYAMRPSTCFSVNLPLWRDLESSRLSFSSNWFILC